MDGQHGEQHHPLRQVHVDAAGVLGQVAVGKHDALALAGGAGGEHDGTQLVRLGLKVKGSLVFRQQLGEGEGGVVVLLLLHDHHVLQLGAVLLGSPGHVFAGSIGHQGGHIGPVQQLPHVGGGEGGVQGNGHAAAVDDAQIGHHPAVGGGADDGDVAALLAQSGQGAGKALTVLAELVVGLVLNLVLAHLITHGYLGAKALLGLRQDLADGTGHSSYSCSQSARLWM